MFLTQSQGSAYNGFMEGQLGADPEYGTCLQCAAIDRARLKTNPITPRSDICSRCFKKYCYDPVNPPPEGQIVGRRYEFNDPDPFGIRTFYEGNKSSIIVGGVFVGLIVLAAIAGCVIFWRRRHQGKKARAVTYQRLSRAEGSDWSADMGQQSYKMGTSRYDPPGYETANGHYSEPSDATLKPDFAEPSHEGVKAHYAEPSDETVIGAEASGETAKPQYASPSHPPPS